MVAISDTLRALENKKPSRKSAAHILRGKVWLSYVLATQNLTPEEFSEQFLEGLKGGHASLIYKWAKSETAPSPLIAERVGQSVPASKVLYDLPLWTLLEDKPIPKSVIDKLVSPYWFGAEDNPLAFWGFPEDEFARANYSPTTFTKYNSQGLVERGDLYGFFAVAALVRDAEAVGDPDLHWHYISDLYRAIPAIAKTPWFKPHLNQLRECIENIHQRFMTSYYLCRANWGVIQKQIEDPAFETIRERRPRDPKTLRFYDLEDPIILNIDF